MSGKILKIESIKNMAVFQDFQWHSSVRDKGNNVAEFKKINILYGRNYSGKTTLSRILRSLETGDLSDKFTLPKFQLKFDDHTQITQDSLSAHSNIIRVFNEDFVKENLSFIYDESQPIKSFAILGGDNAKLEKEIEQYQKNLGSVEENTGLIGAFFAAEQKFNYSEKLYANADAALESKLKDKANNSSTGIKHNKIFGNANYNVTQIKRDIDSVSVASYVPLTDELVREYNDLLREERKEEVKASISFDLQYSDIASRGKFLIEKKIQASNPIQELLSDAALAAWVRTGREHHKGKRTKCAFCGNNIPTDLWEKLEKHFNQESEALRTAIENMLTAIDKEIQRIPNLLIIKNSDFYSCFSKDLDALKEQFSMHSIAYCQTLEFIKKQLENRKSCIFTELTFNVQKSVEQDLNGVRDAYEVIRIKSNHTTSELTAKQSLARTNLRLHEVYNFIVDIKYADECSAIEKLKEACDKAKETKKQEEQAVVALQAKIAELKAQLKDESKGAKRVNDYLNNFFGHQSLSLKAIRDLSESASNGYQFEVFRNGVKAFNLSEGECSLIAFCYFMAKLDDVDTKGNKPIIWIDDPISSLDTNHIFFVYSLIHTKIVTPDKYEEDGKQKCRDRFEQLFISTHNLDFLKYLKRLPGASKNAESQYFIINRTEQSSDLILMPGYLKDYVTEFNYLFHQIYKCAHAQTVCNENHACFYNFANNARKFLEAFLYYKYPNAIEKDDKLFRFFGEDELSVPLIGRINHEFSHLDGLFERSTLPIDVPEMKTIARFILKKIKEKDLDQYTALLQSIGEHEELLED